MSETYRHYLQPQVVSRLANMELRARLVVEGFITGLHRSPYHGFSVEFAEHRPYMPGDEIKHIDWKLYGKTDRHYVKRYEEETNLKAYLILDTSRSMAYASEGRMPKLEYASSLAAALAYMMVKQQDAVGLVTFDQQIRARVRPSSNPSHLQQVFQALDTATQCRTNCTVPRCGDGVFDAGEVCDDGNTTDGDGCSSDCRRRASR